MCTNSNIEKLTKFKNKQSIIAYKIISNIDGYFYPIYKNNRYCFGSNKKMLTWDNSGENPFEILNGFSVFLNKKDAIKVFNNIKNIYLGVQVYKVKCSNVVNAGKWGYSVQKNSPFDKMNVAEVRYMEFLEKIR